MRDDVLESAELRFPLSISSSESKSESELFLLVSLALSRLGWVELERFRGKCDLSSVR